EGEVEAARGLDRQVSGRGAPKNPRDLLRITTAQLGPARAIAKQAAGLRHVRPLADRRQPTLERQRRELPSLPIEERIGLNDQCLGAGGTHGGKRSLVVLRAGGVEGEKVEPDAPCDFVQHLLAARAVRQRRQEKSRHAMRSRYCLVEQIEPLAIELAGRDS